MSMKHADYDSKSQEKFTEGLQLRRNYTFSSLAFARKESNG